MGRRLKTFQPNAVLQSAIYSGLVTLERLARTRVNSRTERYYKSIRKNWRKAQAAWELTLLRDPYDYSSIQNAEPNIRGAYLGGLWVDTARFGNTETKRVYSWEEGTVGPLNALLNFAGARLRDLALIFYPFPEPLLYQVRVYPDNTTKVIPKSVVDRLGKDFPIDNAEKVYWKAGYSGNRYGPRILLAHPTLPGMDFVDMIRAHLVELCKQCFNNSVPRSGAHRYIRLLIHRLRPYLDWVYTQRETGMPNFNPESDQILSEIVREIRALFGRRAGVRRSVTKELYNDDGSLNNVAELRELIVQYMMNKTLKKKEKKLCQRILDEIDQGRIVDRDVEKLMTQVSSLITREGNYWHRVLLSKLHHPASFKQVVYAGDKMMDDDYSSVLVVAELPVERRSGQIDLTFSIRREIPGRTVLTPVMILEIKSKAGLGFNLYSTRSRNKKKMDYGPKLHAWKRRWTDNEWNTISNSKASKRIKDQLDAYEKKLIAEYRRLVPSDPTPPESLWKGVVVLDTDQRPLEVVSAFQNLLTDLKMAIANDLIDSSILRAYSPNPEDSLKPSRLTLLLTPSDGPSEFISEAVPLTAQTEEDPFSERVKDERDLTVYISIPSSTSSGNAAAWISRNWHLLHHLRECEKTSFSERTEITWLDLMGVFKCLDSDEPKTGDDEDEDKEKEKQLIRTRFGLDELVRQRRISRWTHRQLVDLVERINYVDLSPEINKLVEDNSSDPSSILGAFEQVSDVGSDTHRIVIVDGWSEFADLIPWERRHIVRHLERALLDVLPVENTNVIWIDSGVSHTRMNPYYQRKCIRPLPHDSHRRKHIDEILYNLPSSPDSFGKLTPREEDTRVIIQDTPTKVRPWVRSIDVPQLRGFASKVYGTRRRDGTVPEEEVFRRSDMEPMYNRGVTLSGIVAQQAEDIVEEIENHSVTLVPSVLRTRYDEPVIEEEDDEEFPKPRHPVFEEVDSPCRSPTIAERMVLFPEEPPPVFSRNRYYDAGTITRGWCYDSFPKEPKEPNGPVRRPPLIAPTASSGVDTETSRELELKRLLHAAEFLMRRVPKYEDLYQMCEDVVQICTRALRSGKGSVQFLSSLRDVRKTILKRSSTIWNELAPTRSEIIELLNSENRRTLKGVIDWNPDVLELYGNNLFLTICAVIEELVPVKLQSSVACRLWSVVVEWIPYQLGFERQKGAVQTKYDLQAIHSNLRHRARALLDIPASVKETVTEEWGQFLWTEEDEGVFNVWVIVRDEKEMVGGLLTGLSAPMVSARWNECVTDPKEQRSASRQAMKSVNHTPLITQQYGERTILWILVETLEEDKVWVPFHLEYPNAQYSESNLLPWMKLSEVPLQILTELQAPASMGPPPHVKTNVDRFLESVSGTTEDPLGVTLIASIDLGEVKYQVDFYHDNERIETLKFSDTRKFLRVLRHPIRLGTGLEVSGGRLITWDRKRNIEYTDVKVKHEGGEEAISLTLLKPLVHRNRFFPGEFFVPKTCGELLATREGGPLTLVIHTVDSSFRELSVEVEGVPGDSPLRTLENVGMNIYDIGLLTECEQLVDRETMKRYNVNLDVKELFDLRFKKLSDYPRLKAAIDELDVSGHDWTREVWAVDIFAPPDMGNQIRWSISSRESGKTWKKKVFDYEMNPALSIDEVVSDFRETVSQIVPLKHVPGVSDMVTRLKNILYNQGWREGKPRCRVDLEQRGGAYVTVVSRLESEGELREIDSFPVDVTEEVSVLSDRLEMEYGLLSEYDVVNLSEFYEAISVLRGEGKQEGATEQDMGDEILRVFLIRDLALKAKVLLKEGREKREIESVLQEARALIEKMKSSKSKQELSKRIDGLISKVRKPSY